MLFVAVKADRLHCALLRAEFVELDPEAARSTTNQPLDEYEAMVLSEDSHGTPPLCDVGGPTITGFEDSAHGSSDSADSSDPLEEDSASFDAVGMLPSHSGEYGFGIGCCSTVHLPANAADGTNLDVLIENSEIQVSQTNAQALR